ncbi:alpha/beta hydrolase [Mycobacterium sp.]|uniref:alpha/beta fold hydrolase n=1 Tax=Mycobacterium sp. TaxID=1785 RepID=UPI002BA5387E|nr:alpha/beta hydrolase [Mycobacterium sp.]HME49295.1 alpha/beta hydrolase [Mycobacterium sp.]
MATIDLPVGTIYYEDSGPPDGPVIVFVHGLLVDGSIWRSVVTQLSGQFRCVVPTLPMGAHITPMRDRAAATPLGVADVLADVLDRLDLHDVTLVANDTGGAISQLLLTRRPQRVGRIVLTNCDSHDNWLPPDFKNLQRAARARLLGPVLALTYRVPAIRDSRLGFGLLHKRPIPAELISGWTRPVLTSRGVRRDVTDFTRHIDNRLTLDAATRLSGFGGPALIAWAPGDRVFPMRYAERLRDAFTKATLVTVQDSGSFIPLDQPGELARLVRDFIGSSS